MTNRALKIGQLIANAHPADVRLLFQEYGITVAPTGKTILDAYLVYGDPFLKKLLTIASKSISQFSNTTGDPLIDGGVYDPTIAGDTQASTKASWFDKAIAIFGTAGTTLTTVSTAWNDIASIFNGGKTVYTGTASSNSALQAELYQLQLEAEKESAANQTKTYLLVGAGILVLVLAIFMYLKSQK